MRFRDGLPVSTRLWLLQRDQERIGSEHDQKIRKLRKEKAGEDAIESAEFDAHTDYQEIDSEIMHLQTNHLIRCAARYNLPFPEQGDWEENPYIYRNLTRAALVRLRSAIRQERKERWEEWTRWTPLLSSLTGLLGVVVAIIALFAKAATGH